MTKFEIIKDAYEAQFSSGKYEQSSMRQTYQTPIETAMDLFAKQQCILYEQWLLKKIFPKIMDGPSADESSESLYNQFIEHQNKQV